ncbi:MAG: hypothetical protein LBP26_06225, partial [Clostridiales bacterium]|nr:hypothetical protein [Clostridiales bacterium]
MKHYYSELCAAYPDEMAGVQCCVFTAYIKKKEQIFQSVHGYFLTLSHEPDECQADFGRFFYLDAGGAERVGQIVALSFPYAGVSYAQVLPGKSTEGFLVCMQNIFRHIGGAPRELWLDNDSAYVSILYHGKKYERFLTPFFDSFCRHFEMKPVFMTAFQGHEKGSVENSASYLRRNLLVPY